MLPQVQLDRSIGKSKVLYRQVHSILKNWIHEGYFQGDAAIPSARKLATHFQVNLSTIRQAIQELKDEGLVHSQSTKGVFVCPNSHGPRGPSTIKVGIGSIHMYPGLIGPYHLHLLSQLKKHLEERGYGLELLSLHDLQESQLMGAVEQMKVDLMVYVGSVPPKFLHYFVQHGPPAVLFDTSQTFPQTFTIDANLRSGSYLAMEHLYRQGHRKIGVITGPRDDVFHDNKSQGVKDALDIFPDLRVKTLEGNYQSDGGIHCTRMLTQGHFKPTALFYFNDEMALAGMRELIREKKCNIPEDYSIVGFDNIPASQHSEPPLSSVKVPLEAMCRELIKVIESVGHSKVISEPLRINCPSSFIPRASSLLP